MATNASLKEQLGAPAAATDQPAPSREPNPNAQVALRPTGGGVAPLGAKVEYARLLAESGLLPKQYVHQPANLLWAIEYGEMLGLSPMAAITGVHVIEGKPTASAGLISALVRRAGHRLRVTGSDVEAVAQIVRSDDPDFVFESRWTIDRAKQAGLTGKSVWKQYPAAMLKARAISEVARDACEEALSGVHYTPEELGAVVDVDGNVIEGTVLPAAPAPATEVVDWAALAEAAADIDGVRDVWSRAAQAGVLDEELRGELNRIAAGKTRPPDPPVQEPEPVDVTDAEVIEDPPAGYDDAEWLASGTGGAQ